MKHLDSITSPNGIARILYDADQKFYKPFKVFHLGVCTNSFKSFGDAALHCRIKYGADFDKLAIEFKDDNISLNDRITMAGIETQRRPDSPVILRFGVKTMTRPSADLAVAEIKRVFGIDI